jgi:hypothetical protein
MKQLIFFLLFMISSSNPILAQGTPRIIGQKFTFYDGERGALNCNECDPIWEIRFIDQTNGILISRRPNKSSEYGSCKTSLKYKYNAATKTITILQLSNNNVSSDCLNKFIGEWQWRKGKFFDMRFYSKSNPECDFS